MRFASTLRPTILRPRYAAGLACAVAAAVAGCSSPGAGHAAGTASPTPVSALAAVRIAGKSATTVDSVTGTFSVRITTKPGASGTPAASGSALGSLSVTGSVAERLHPSLTGRVDINAMSVDGTAVPGAIEEIVTPSAFYMRAPSLTQALHSVKPWLVLPLSALNKQTGINFSQLMSTASQNGPLTQTTLLTGASSVREVGKGTVAGTPVTQYTGTISLDKAYPNLPADTRSQLTKAAAAAGFHTATFTAWIDAQNVTRKVSVSMAGTSITETITSTITSVNQPVSVTVPPASQTTQLPTTGL